MGMGKIESEEINKWMTHLHLTLVTAINDKICRRPVSDTKGIITEVNDDGFDNYNSMMPVIIITTMVRIYR